MTDKEINDAFDEILKNIEEQSKKPLEMPEIDEEEEKEKEVVVEEPVIDNNPVVDSVEETASKEEPTIVSPSPSVDDLVRPILEEIKQEPLVINFDERSNTKPEFNPITIEQSDVKVEEKPVIDIPNLVGDNNRDAEPTIPPFEIPQKDSEEEVVDSNNKPKLPNMSTIIKKSIGQVIIPKTAKAKEMAKELYEKKKQLINKVIAIALISVTTLGIADYAVEQGYKTPSTKFAQFVSSSSEIEFPETDLGDVGWEIADKITTEMQQFNVMNNDPSKQYDANKAVLQVFGSIYKQVVRTLPYTKKGTNDKAWGAGERNDYWLTYMYDVMQYHLKTNGTINLPETLEEYLAANGLNRGKMNYNPVTNKLRIEDSEEPVSYYQSLDNLKEYSDYLIGHTPNPAVKVAKEYTDKYLELQNMYPDYSIRLSHDGITIYADYGSTPVYKVVSLNPIVLMEVQKNVNEEGVASARS